MIKTSHVATLLLSAAVTFAQGTSPQTGQSSGSSTTPQSSSQTTGSTTPETSGQTTDTTTPKSTSKTRSSRTSDTSQASGESMVGPSDRAFLMKAAEGGMMEVQLAQLAQKQAGSDGVKQYAQKLEQDHTAANKQLMDIAQRRNINVPSTLKPEDQKMIDQLTKLSGSDFDKAYIKHMVKDHKKDVKEFERESSSGMDTDLKTFATSTVPTLKDHLTQAESLEKNTGSSSGTRSRTKDHGTKDQGSKDQGSMNNSNGNTTGTGTTGSSPASSGSSTTTPPPQK